jgi:hypothetical protein
MRLFVQVIKFSLHIASRREMHISKHLQDLELEVSAGLSLFLSDSLLVSVLTKIAVFFSWLCVLPDFIMAKHRIKP